MADDKQGGAPLRLARWRKRRRLNQTQAALLAGVRQSTWNDWEHGKKAPRVTQANRLHRLKICPVKLWGEGEPVAASPDGGLPPPDGS